MSLMMVLLIKYYSGDQIEKIQMGAACGTYGGEKRRIYVLKGNLKDRDHMQDLVVDGRIILKCMWKVIIVEWIRIFSQTSVTVFRA
jgi:hypothetical protein